MKSRAHLRSLFKFAAFAGLIAIPQHASAAEMSLKEVNTYTSMASITVCILGTQSKVPLQAALQSVAVPFVGLVTEIYDSKIQGAGNNKLTPEQIGNGFTIQTAALVAERCKDKLPASSQKELTKLMDAVKKAQPAKK